MQLTDVQDIQRRVSDLKWYHTIDLGNGLVTQGDYDHRPYLPMYGLPHNLSGKTALDIGAASGFFSFELERRGAHVTATDLPEWRAHDFGPRYRFDMAPDEANRYLHDPFLLAKSVLGSQVEKHEINIYDISPQTVGTFDLVFCASVLLHLTDPVRALWRIQSVTRECAVIATVIRSEPATEPLAQFVGHYRGDGWWFPNRCCLERMIESAGFKRWEWVSEFRLDYRDRRPGPYHGVIWAWNTEQPALLPVKPAGSGLPHRAPANLEQIISEQDSEIQPLRAQVAGYERGKFMRLMRWLKRA